MNSFEGDTADDVWRQAAQSLLLGSPAKKQESRSGTTIELLHCNFHIRKPRERWVFSREPAISPAYAIAEVFWILAGRNDAAFVNFWNPRLPEFAGKTSTYHGAYGHRIRKHFGLDQLERAYLALRNQPSGRQVVIQIWDPMVDFPKENGSEVSEDVPCNICSMLKVRDGRLEWTQIMRSNDIFRGLPHNVVQFTMLQEIVAGWLGLELGGYYHVSDSLHAYESALAQFSISPVAASAQTHDRYDLPKEISDNIIRDIALRLEELSKEGLSTEHFKRLCDSDHLPAAYRNLLLIVAADSARRRGWYDEMKLAVSGCNNSALQLLWGNWLRRTSPRK